MGYQHFFGKGYEVSLLIQLVVQYHHCAHDLVNVLKMSWVLVMNRFVVNQDDWEKELCLTTVFRSRLWRGNMCV